MKTTETKKQVPAFQTPHEKARHGTPAKAATKKQEAKPKKAAKQQPKPAKKAKTPRKGKLGELLGYSVVSVIRAMGRAGWDYETARAALEAQGVEAADHTVKVGLKRGRDGDKTRFIAPVSAKQLASLKAK
jgi:hypothetical protein